MKLVIVESPNKCHTISRYLGEGYEVLATVGHLRDLSTSGKGGFGVDVENGFKPTYVVSSGKGGTVAQLKEAARKAREEGKNAAPKAEEAPKAETKEKEAKPAEEKKAPAKKAAAKKPAAEKEAK